MKVLITGGGGFLGYRLAKALLEKGTLRNTKGEEKTISQITLLDIAFPNPVDPRLSTIVGDLNDKQLIATALGKDTEAVFHLASVVSGAAEADLDLGMRVNIDGTRALLDACRALNSPPKFLFSSSLAVFGGTLPPVLDDSTMPKPQTSYGAQKVCCEYIISDYSRKGLVDARILRLPTISIRPGKPNMAASSFASGIIREPLNGVPAMCPVGRETALWLLSPSKVIAAFIHAHDLASEAWGNDRVVNIAGITTSVGKMVDALEKVAGKGVTDRIEWKKDARIESIVMTWPAHFKTPRASAMGFVADACFEDMIRDYIREENIVVR